MKKQSFLDMVITILICVVGIFFLWFGCVLASA